MIGLLIMIISAFIMGAAISYHSNGLMFCGFMVMIYGLYEVGRIR